ncbi:MAG TPA: FkbM family methyltransferase, partial [Chitinophagaceae bacterium]|nr:FkbM family methyltransferase [Chitinophagaceae bacterium]
EDRKMISVEANPYLLETAKENIRKHCRAHFEVLHAAIAYGVPEVSLSITTNNTAGQVGHHADARAEHCIVPAVSLRQIIAHHNVGKYILISDIEGSEIEMLVNDGAALQYCSAMIIELHETSYNGRAYSIDDLSNMITGLGFTKVYSEGPVYFFRK